MFHTGGRLALSAPGGEVERQPSQDRLADAFETFLAQLEQTHLDDEASPAQRSGRE